MRRTSNSDDPERGLSAALKALAIVAAVGMLVLVAGKSAYTTGAVTEVSPTYHLLQTARDAAPKVSAATPEKSAR
ncbi:MAG: hypothetical protein ABI607_07385 [Betaproteobacteria bacterium]